MDSGHGVGVAVTIITSLGRVIEINRLYFGDILAKTRAPYICRFLRRLIADVCECESHAFVVRLMTNGCNETYM